MQSSSKKSCRGGFKQVDFRSPTFPQGLQRLRKKGTLTDSEARNASPGAKAPLILLTLSARLKPCPVTELLFSAACKAHLFSSICGTRPRPRGSPGNPVVPSQETNVQVEQTKKRRKRPVPKCPDHRLRHSGASTHVVGTPPLLPPQRHIRIDLFHPSRVGKTGGGMLQSADF